MAPVWYLSVCSALMAVGDSLGGRVSGGQHGNKLKEAYGWIAQPELSSPLEAESKSYHVCTPLLTVELRGRRNTQGWW